MRVRPAPEVRRYEGWRFASFDEGTAALRRLAQDGPRPTVLRLSDETETLIGLAQPDAVGASLERQDAGCLAVVGFEGTGEDTAHRREGAAEILRESGGTFAGRSRGALGPRPLLGAVPARRAARRRGARRDPGDGGPLVPPPRPVRRRPRGAHRHPHRCGHPAPGHVPHLARLRERRLAVLHGRLRPGEDAVAHWTRAKHAANDAILAAGGTITHHHAVGTDHRDWYVREAGPLGVEALRAVKRSLDPAGLLSPGVLLPAD